MLGLGPDLLLRRPSLRLRSVGGRVPTSDGLVSDDCGGDVTLLRYWYGEVAADSVRQRPITRTCQVEVITSSITIPAESVGRTRWR